MQRERYCDQCFSLLQITFHRPMYTHIYQFVNANHFKSIQNVCTIEMCSRANSFQLVSLQRTYELGPQLCMTEHQKDFRSNPDFLFYLYLMCFFPLECRNVYRSPIVNTATVLTQRKLGSAKGDHPLYVMRTISLIFFCILHVYIYAGIKLKSET